MPRIHSSAKCSDLVQRKVIQKDHRSAQSLLALRLDQGVGFRDFYSPAQAKTLTKLKDIIKLSSHYFFSAAQGQGKSHLLMATCNALRSQGHSAMYLPLRQKGLDINILAGIDAQTHLLIDDVDCVIGSRAWEVALIQRHDACKENAKIVWSSSVPRGTLKYATRDLKTRLMMADADHMPMMRDEHKVEALKLKAARLGFSVPEHIIVYILNQHSRDMHALADLIVHID